MPATNEKSEASTIVPSIWQVAVCDLASGDSLEVVAHLHRALGTTRGAPGRYGGLSDGRVGDGGHIGGMRGAGDSRGRSGNGGENGGESGGGRHGG